MVIGDCAFRPNLHYYICTLHCRYWYIQGSKELRILLLILFFIITFQTTSLGARIDLRTFMAGTLNPTIIKKVMDTSQQLRILYYHIRICDVFLQSYRFIYLIMAKVGATLESGALN